MPLPQEGAYVVLRLLPAIPESERGLYVGYIHEILSFPDATKDTHKCRIRFLSPAKPEPSEVDGTTSDMAVPVFPTRDSTGGTPLHPTGPMPWPACWHHSALANVLARVRVRVVEQAEPVFVSFEEMYGHDLEIEEDERKRREWRQRNWADSMGTEGSGSNEEIDLVNDFAMQLATSSSNPANSAPSEDEGHSTSTSDVDDDNAEGEEDAGLPLLELVSYDLSISPALMDPRRLFDEIAASERIGEQRL